MSTLPKPSVSLGGGGSSIYASSNSHLIVAVAILRHKGSQSHPSLCALTVYRQNGMKLRTYKEEQSQLGESQQDEEDENIGFKLFPEDSTALYIHYEAIERNKRLLLSYM